MGFALTWLAMWLRKKKPAAPTIVIDRCLGDPELRRMRDALAAKDWDTARGVLIKPASPEHLALGLILAADTAGLEAWIDGPVAAEPGEPLPLLVKGARLVYWAWEARGTGGSQTVAQDTWKVWFDRLRRAEDCFDEVVTRDPSSAEAWHWLIVLGRARQVPAEERWRRFHGLVAADPTHLYGHRQMLDGLMKKWSGSDEAMFEFAREQAAKHPGTHLPMLVADAHAEHRFSNGGADYLERPEVADEIVAAAHASIWHPDYRPSLLTPIALNVFAKMFALADRFAEAERCFAAIGEDRVTRRPWDEHKDGTAAGYQALRDYVRTHGPTGGTS